MPADRAYEREPSLGEFRDDCIRGLSCNRKAIPAKWLYDEVGSDLFDRICALPEYYPYRTETALLIDAAAELAHIIGPGVTLVELGSGASRKTRILLDALPAIGRYVPIDINPIEVERASADIRADYPLLVVAPVVADFADLNRVAVIEGHKPALVFFPGSTLGNFLYAEAIDLLRTIRGAVGRGGRLLLGVDMLKDVRTLIPAYDDAADVTAAFNLNLLDRMNRELDGDIDVGAFRHRALWNEALSRIEMHLVARNAVAFEVGGTGFRMREGDSIHTENSHKWSADQLARMFAAAGWRECARWQAQDPSFLLALLDA